jgi:hypothetical protein
MRKTKRQEKKSDPSSIRGFWKEHRASGCVWEGGGRGGPRAGCLEAGFKLKLEECLVGCSFLQNSIVSRIETSFLLCNVLAKGKNRQSDGEGIRTTSFHKKSLQCNAVPCIQ